MVFKSLLANLLLLGVAWACKPSPEFFALKPTEAEQKVLDATERALQRAIKKSEFGALMRKIDAFEQCREDEACAATLQDKALANEHDAYLLFRQHRPTQRDLELALHWQNQSMLWQIRQARIWEQQGDPKSANRSLREALKMPWNSALVEDVRAMVIELLRIKKQHQLPIALRKYLDPCGQIWGHLFIGQSLDLNRLESSELLDSEFCKEAPSRTRQRLCKRLEAKLSESMGSLACAWPGEDNAACEAIEEQVQLRLESCPVDFYLEIAQLIGLNPAQAEQAFQRLLQKRCAEL